MKNLFLFFLLLSSFGLKAQNADPVKWSFYSVKEKEPDTYTVYAKAQIADGWHVFTPTPGGDGLLIPTEHSFDHPEKFRDTGALTTEGKEIQHDMEFVGKVNYFEHEAIFKVTLIVYQPHTVTGRISYQLCNDRMCLPPTEVPFSIKL